ncbi:MAG TPA: hypothetical protein DHV28_15190 [Ignavibacteriales bacterium]|nr:hypothetical protein [Ignavibacteriales bacterium]
MKILHIIPSYMPAFRFGGPIQSVHLLNKTLIKKGVEVDVLTTNAGLSQEQREQILRQAQDDKERWNDVDGVRVKYVSFIGYEHFNFSLTYVRELKNIIKNYDLVHITAIWNFPVLIGMLMGVLYNKPFIISPRGALYSETVKARKSTIKKIYFNALLKPLIKKSNSIHFTSELDRDRFFEYTKISKNYFIVPNGLELDRIFSVVKFSAEATKFDLFTNNKYILFLGRINFIKGLDILIRAFSNLPAEFKEINLIIAGPDNEDYSYFLKKIISENNLKERVLFTGMLNFEEKICFLKHAELFVLPSYSENFGNVVIEAMACDCPVVISNKVGIYKEVDEYNAGIVVQTTEQSVTEGISKLLNNTELRKKTALKGKEMVKKYYDINKVADQMIKQYIKIIISHSYH